MLLLKIKAAFYLKEKPDPLINGSKISDPLVRSCKFSIPKIMSGTSLIQWLRFCLSKFLDKVSVHGMLI